jgi:uncharacterized protein YjiS (DUF1127 family)
VIANVAAQHCNRNDIARLGDNPVTGGHQKSAHNDLWEHQMLAKGSSGSANRLLRPYDVLVVDLGVMEGPSTKKGRPVLAEVRSLPAVTEPTGADHLTTGFWSSVTKFLVEGFAQCAVSMHPTMFYPQEPDPEEPKILEPREMRWRERRRLIALVSKPASRDEASCEAEHATSQAALAGAAAALVDGHPNELEREIEKTVAALARLDDRTLWDLGILDRSQIELTVRYCHDC